MKKILIFSSFFYPDPVVGAVRITQMAKFLPCSGWEVYVVCKNHGNGLQNEEVSKVFGPNVHVIYLNSIASSNTNRKNEENGTTSKLRNSVYDFLSTYLFASDASIIFWRHKKDEILKIVNDVRPDAFITTGPQNSIHSIGLWIKRRFPNIIWVSDFRDLFRIDGRYRAPFLQRYQSYKSFRYENSIYKESDQIICAIPTHKRWIAMKFRQYIDKVQVILNGVPEPLCFIQDLTHLKKAGPLRATVAGFAQTNEAVLLAKAVQSLNSQGYNIVLSFVGYAPFFKEEIANILTDSVNFTGPVSHDKALSLISSSDILIGLLSQQRSRQFNLTSKMFEYLAVPAPVLLINPTRPDRRMFSKFPGVQIVSTPTVDDIIHSIKDLLQIDQELLSSRATTISTNWRRKDQIKSLSNIILAIQS